MVTALFIDVTLHNLLVCIIKFM